MSEDMDKREDTSKEADDSHDGGSLALVGKVALLLLAAVGLVAILAHANAEDGRRRAAMTAEAKATVTQVIEERHVRKRDKHTVSREYRYEVSFEDDDHVRHNARTIDAEGRQQWFEGDAVTIEYDPLDPDGGCRILGRAIDPAAMEQIRDDLNGTGTTGEGGTADGSDEKPVDAAGDNGTDDTGEQPGDADASAPNLTDTDDASWSEIMGLDRKNNEKGGK